MKLLRSLTILSLLLALACGDDDTTDGGMEDASTDTATDVEPDVPAPTCDGVEEFEMPSADPHEDPLGAADGEARAGLLPASALPEEGSLLTWDEGDFVLANDRVAIVIEQAGESEGYDIWGGKPVGVARIEGGEMVNPADFNEVIPAIGRFSFEPTTVGVLSDGSDGGPAVVRAVGPLRAIPFVDEFAAALAPGDFRHMQVAVDYSLAPGASTIDVSYTVSNDMPRGFRTLLLAVIFQSSRMPIFSEEGFGVETGHEGWVGYDSPDTTSYILSLSEGTQLTLELAGAGLFQRTPVIIDPCGQTVFDYYSMTVGDADGMEGAKAAFWQDNGESLTTISGEIFETAEVPAEGVYVFAENSDGHVLTRDLTGADGAYSMRVPEGESVTLRTYRTADGVGDAFADPESAPLLGERGVLQIETVDGDASPIPVRIQIRPSDFRGVPAKYGAPRRLSGRTHTLFPVDGSASIPLPPGDYQVTVSRGFEYTLFDSMVTVTAGATNEQSIVLDRVVDTTNVMCADYHIHTTRSPDSPDGANFKLRSAAADGVEIPCRSDHEWVLGWEPLVAPLGLSDHLYGLSSLELTTFAWGHFGVVPVQPRPDQRNGGIFDWVGRTPGDVFDEVRELDEDPVIIINHPRGVAASGYFTAVDLDPLTGEANNLDLWSNNFDAIEVFNDGSFRGKMEEVNDWFALLNAGQRVFAVGSSDSHTVMSGSAIGYPRTCLRVGTDDPNELRAMNADNTVRDATRDGEFTVVGGIYIDATARGGVQPGGEVTGAMATESIDVRVQAAPWVDVDVLEVWVDGELVESFDINASEDVIRFEETIEVTTGSYVVFHAVGDENLGPVHPGKQPFGVTMPIFFTP